MVDFLQATWIEERVESVSNEVAPSFDYSAQPEHIRQKIDETHGLLKRTAANIIKIGQNLSDLRNDLKHGEFLPCLQSEFDMSQRTAYNFMNVAEKFGGKFATVANLPPKVLYELASPSTPDTVVNQVTNGELPADLESIRKAKEALKKAEEESARLRSEAQTKQNQLDLYQTERETLSEQIKGLQGKITTLENMPPKEKEVYPESVKKELDALKEQVKKLNEQRENLAKEARNLTDQLKEKSEARQEQAFRDKLRQQWQKSCTEATKSLRALLVSWPTPQALEYFEADEWAYLDQLQETLHQVVGSCRQLHEHTIQGRVVDAATVDA